MQNAHIKKNRTLVPVASDTIISLPTRCISKYCFEMTSPHKWCSTSLLATVFIARLKPLLVKLCEKKVK